jgi:uncharacterized membrane protein
MRDLKQTLLDGAMVLLPVGAIAMLAVAVVEKLQHVTDPLAGHIVHPAISAIVILLLACLALGLAVRTLAGRWTQRKLEALLFDKIPGYRLAKVVTGDGAILGGKTGIRPALAEIEEGQCPALVMDEFADGRLLVFVPGAPAPMSGQIFIFTPDKVEILDVPLMPFIKTISSWGLGLKELIEASKH